MARIKLSSGFSIIPEGTYVFKVDKVEEDDDFGIIDIHFVTADGQTLRERFTLMDKDGDVVEGAMNAFSYLAKVLMNDFTLVDLDPQELTGRYIKAGVKHTKAPSKKDPSKTNTYAHLDDKEPATAADFGEQPAEEVSDLLESMPF